MSQPAAVEQRVLRFVTGQQLVPKGEKLLVAVSGGPDSVCLLHVLVNLREALGISLHVAHLDHRLRGAESEADAAYVAGLAHRLGIPATIEERDVREYQARRHLSLEEAAREVRYDFLARSARSTGAGRVAVGHTAGDHVETVLMHLIRGSGGRGLRGLLPLSRWQSGGESLVVVRPLLPLTREETSEYCQRHRLMPRIDVSNLSLSPFRNRIRLELLPLLKGYNPGIAGALMRTAGIAAGEMALLDRLVEEQWSDIVQESGSAVALDRKRLAPLHPALKRHLLRTAIERLTGDIKDIEANHVEQVLEALDKPAGKRLELPGGLLFIVEHDRYILSKDAAALSPFPALDGEFPLRVPGETDIPGWQVTATVLRPSETVKPEGEFNACFDMDKVGAGLAVRQRRRGDRFQPLGMAQPKKLGEFMIDARIPAAWRERIPIVCSPQQVLWVVGYRIDERVKVTAGTGKVLCLKFERDPGNSAIPGSP